MPDILNFSAPTTPAAPVTGCTLIAEGLAHPDSIRGAGASVRIEALENGAGTRIGDRSTPMTAGIAVGPASVDLA